jgi:hypothetical protein
MDQSGDRGEDGPGGSCRTSRRSHGSAGTAAGLVRHRRNTKVIAVAGMLLGAGLLMGPARWTAGWRFLPAMAIMALMLAWAFMRSEVTGTVLTKQAGHCPRIGRRYQGLRISCGRPGPVACAPGRPGTARCASSGLASAPGRRARGPACTPVVCPPRLVARVPWWPRTRRGSGQPVVAAKRRHQNQVNSDARSWFACSMTR